MLFRSGGVSGRLDEPHRRHRHHQHHHAVNDAPIFVPAQPFTESSIFRGPGNHDSQHNVSSSVLPPLPLPPHPSSASHYIADPFGNVFPGHDPAHPPHTPGRVIINGRNVAMRRDSIPSTAFHLHAQPEWTPGAAGTYFIGPLGSLSPGFQDLHLRAPGARIVVDGVDYTDRLQDTSQRTRPRESARTEPRHHHNRLRNVFEIGRASCRERVF